MAEIICPISGVRLISAPYMLGFKMKELHPIFRMKRKDLVTEDLVHRFRKAQDIEEKRLYFLGVLHSTDLVSFNCITCPSLRTVENNFLRAVEIAGWIDYAAYQVPKEIALPRYVVREDNKEMDNIGTAFLFPIEELRKAFLSKQIDREKSQRMQATMERLFKELADAFKKDRLFTPFTVDWALEYTELSKHPRASLFKQVLLTKESEAWGIDRDTLLEIRELFGEEFDLNHPFAAPFFGQLERLQKAQIRGFGDFEIVEESISFVDEEGMEQEKMVSLQTVYQEKMVKDYGSTEKPEKKDFATYPKWLVAMAKWKLSQSSHVSLQSIESTTKENSV